MLKTIFKQEGYKTAGIIRNRKPIVIHYFFGIILNTRRKLKYF